MKKNIIIAGGGIAGLLSAYFLSKKTTHNIHLVEKTDSLGGLLKSFDYGEFGKFDYGAHNILESGIKELDDFLISLFELDEWTVLSALNGQKRAFTGVYYNGKLQQNSPYIDLRECENKDELISDFLSNLEKKQEISFSTAYEYSKSIFGNKITQEHINRIFQVLYGTQSKEMDYMAMFLTPLTRVGLFDINIMNDILDTKLLSKYLSYPDQQKLSSKYLGTKKTYYPKEYGMYRVIEKIEKRLIANGVHIHLNTHISSIKYKNNKIEEVTFDNQNFKNISSLYWSAGLSTIGHMLNINMEDMNYDKAPKTAITNILIDKKLDIGDLCYLYNYDKKFKFFRIDNYINYCQNAQRKGFYPISIEMLIKDNSLTDKDIEQISIQELKSLGILQKDTKIIFSKTEILDSGFPLLSTNNVAIFDYIRESIQKKDLKNLVIIGILSEKNLFFQSDIKKDLYNKIKESNHDN